MAAGTARRFFDERLALLESIADIPDGTVRGRRRDGSRPRPVLATANLGFDGLSFVDANGRLRASANPGAAPGLDLSDRSYVQAVLDERRAIRQRGCDQAGGRRTDRRPRRTRRGRQRQRCSGFSRAASSSTGSPRSSRPSPATACRSSTVNETWSTTTVRSTTCGHRRSRLHCPCPKARPGPCRDSVASRIRSPRAPPSTTQVGTSCSLATSRASALAARDSFFRELVLLGVIGAIALAVAWWNARRVDRLHRSEVGHADEIAALEKFTAALAAAESPAAVADAVREHAPAVLGAE